MIPHLSGETIAVLEAAAGLGLAAGGFAYASRWPGSRLFGDCLTAPRRPGEIALTFDDGPNPTWTPRVLDLMAGQGVRGTFFVLGVRAQAQAALVRRMVEEGHLVGNHAWSHHDLTLTPVRRIYAELDQTRQTLEQITGKAVKFFRPPFGARRPAVLRIARELGMRPVLWNTMTSDWMEPSGEKIARRLAAKIDRLERRGRAANVVLHDGGHLERKANREPSVAAVDRLIARYKDTHRFVTLDAWT